MPNPESDDLQAILREQQELRLRMMALDRRIEALRSPVKEVQKKEPEIFRPIPLSIETPPPLPVLTPQPARVAPTPIPVVDVPPPIQKVEETPVPPPKSSLEFKLGTVWLVRIGIVMLLTGLVFLGNYAYHYFIAQIGPIGKVALLYLIGGTLAAIGARLEKRSENLRNYGRVLLAGGVAAIYYTTYAAAFLERLRVIGSPLLGGLLLLAIAGAVVWLAEKRQSQAVALTAILLSYYTSAINPLGVFSLFSNLVLTGAAVFFLIRHRWTTISFLSLAGTYLSFAFWRFYRTGHLLHLEQTPMEFWSGSLFLAGYWILFTAAVFLSRAENFPPEKRTPFLTINNGAFFGLIAPSLAAVYPGNVGRFCLGYGAILLALAWVAKRRQNEDKFLDGAYLIQGLGVFTLGLVTELTGYQLSLALAVQSTVMLCGMRRRHGWVYEIGAGLVALGAFGLVLDGNGWAATDVGIRSTVIGLFLLNAWLGKTLRRDKPEVAFAWRPAAYGSLALLLLAPILFHFVPLHCMEVALVAAGLLMTFGFPRIGLREIGVLSQGYVLLGVAGWLFSAHPEFGEWWTIATVAVGPLVLVHWWQRRQNTAGAIGEIFFSLVLLAVLAQWLTDLLPKDQTLVAFAALAVATLIYGTLTRAFLLALLGQFLIFISTALFFLEIIVRNPEWLSPTAGMALIAADLVLLGLVVPRFPQRLQTALEFLQMAFGAMLFGMSAAWGCEFVAAPVRMLFFIALSSVFFALAAWKPGLKPARTTRLLIYSGLSAVFGLLDFWTVELVTDQVHPLNFIALLILAMQQQIGKRRFAGTELFPRSIQQALIVAVVSGFWLAINHWIEISDSPMPKTVAWALLAMISLGVGLLLRERAYRFLGLGLLALAILRIVCVDVWQLESLHRILSFIALSLVLLGLGFIYNKFADKLREWL